MPVLQSITDDTGLTARLVVPDGPLITHRFPLEAFPDAYRTLREATGPRGKILLEVNPV